MSKAAAMRQQAEAAVAMLGTPTTRGYGVGRSNIFSRAKVHSLPTLLELIAAAICVVSTFVFNHLKATRPDLSPHPHAASPHPHAAAAPDVNKIRWPEVKTMMRMLAKMRSDYIRAAVALGRAARYGPLLGGVQNAGAPCSILAALPSARNQGGGRPRPWRRWHQHRQ